MVTLSPALPCERVAFQRTTCGMLPVSVMNSELNADPSRVNVAKGVPTSVNVKRVGRTHRPRGLYAFFRLDETEETQDVQR